VCVCVYVCVHIYIHMQVMRSGARASIGQEQQRPLEFATRFAMSVPGPGEYEAQESASTLSMHAWGGASIGNEPRMALEFKVRCVCACGVAAEERDGGRRGRGREGAR
jgi:hypothetical protein